MELTRETFKDVFEATGLVAIVASLIFLGIEIRQNTVELRLGNEQAALALGHAWDSWLLDERFAETYDSGIADLSSLTSPQLRVFNTYLGEAFSIWEFTFNSYQSGTMSEETWLAWDRWFSSELVQLSWQSTWRNSKRGVAAPEFQSHVDSIISQHIE